MLFLYRRLLGEALRLPERERAELATKLIEGLEGEVDAAVGAAWAEEIERRCATSDSEEAATSGGEKVRRRVERESDIEIVAFAHTSREASPSVRITRR